MLSTWREEHFLAGTLSPRAPTPRATLSSTGPTPFGAGAEEGGVDARLSARLSEMHTLKVKATSLASSRGVQLLRAEDDLGAMQMQLEVLRAAYDERAAAAAKLEIRLRQEQGVAPKVRKQLEKAQERAVLVLEKEKEARGEITSLDSRLSRVTADLRARELTVKNVMADRDQLVQERDEARAKAANIQVDCDFALADAANARSTVEVFKVTVDRAEKEASQAKMDLEKEREGRRKADLERAEALRDRDSALLKLKHTTQLLEAQRKKNGETKNLGQQAEEEMIMASMNAAGLANALRVEREQHATAISVRETAVRALDSLRTAVGEALCQFLLLGDANEPVRKHNERILTLLVEAIALSGGDMSLAAWRSRLRLSPPATLTVSGGSVASPVTSPRALRPVPPSKREAEWSAAASMAPMMAPSPRPALGPRPPSSTSNMPLSDIRARVALEKMEDAAARAASTAATAISSAAVAAAAATAAVDLAVQLDAHGREDRLRIAPPPVKLALLRRDEREAVQLLFDSMGRMGETLVVQRRHLQTQLHALCAKLQYHGDLPHAREEVLQGLRHLAAESSAVLPVPPSFDASPRNASGLVLAHAHSAPHPDDERHDERTVELEASSRLATAEPLTSSHTSSYTSSRLPLERFLPSAPPPTGSHARKKGREGSPPGYMHPPPGYMHPPPGYMHPPTGYMHPPTGYMHPPPGYMHGEGSLRPRPESINSHRRRKGEHS